MNETKYKLDMACERLAMAIQLGKVIATEKAIAEKWLAMSMKCTNKR